MEHVKGYPEPRPRRTRAALPAESSLRGDLRAVRAVMAVHSSEAPLPETPSPRSLPEDPMEDLPPDAHPIAREFGDLWAISYTPTGGAARYVARPRYGGQTIRTDTARLLGRVLAAAERHIEKLEEETEKGTEGVEETGTEPTTPAE